jgi:Rod binding domain-containing protein
MADLIQNATSTLANPALPKADTPAKIHDAAQQFESLLIGQILESARQGGGWLGSGDDSASGCATGFAEQQLAAMMARSGGFGLAGLIEKGLRGGSDPVGEP